MIINNKDVNLDEAIKFSNYQELLLNRRENGMLLPSLTLTLLKNINPSLLFKGFYYVKFLSFLCCIMLHNVLIFNYTIEGGLNYVFKTM